MLAHLAGLGPTFAWAVRRAQRGASIPAPRPSPTLAAIRAVGRAGAEGLPEALSDCRTLDAGRAVLRRDVLDSVDCPHECRQLRIDPSLRLECRLDLQQLSRREP